MLSQVVFLWVMPKTILGLFCVRFFYPFHRNDSCGSASGSLRSNVSYAEDRKDPCSVSADAALRFGEIAHDHFLMTSHIASCS
jgi:hypothetical protein